MIRRYDQVKRNESSKVDIFFAYYLIYSLGSERISQQLRLLLLLFCYNSIFSFLVYVLNNFMIFHMGIIILSLLSLMITEFTPPVPPLLPFRSTFTFRKPRKRSLTIQHTFINIEGIFKNFYFYSIKQRTLK